MNNYYVIEQFGWWQSKLYVNPFNSQKWLACNFSLQYPNIILHTGNENIQTNRVEVVILIQHQILVTADLQGDVLQLEGRINNQILGLKGLIPVLFPGW